MAFTNRQNKSQAGSVSSLAMFFNLFVKPSALIVVSVTSRNWTTFPTSITVTDNLGNSYAVTPHSGANSGQPNNTYSMWMAYKVVNFSGVLTITATLNGGDIGTGGMDLSISEFGFTLPAYATTVTLDQDASAFSASSVSSPVTVPLAQAVNSHELLFSLIRCDQAPTSSSPWTQFTGNPDSEWILDGNAGGTDPNWAFTSITIFVSMSASFGFSSQFQSTEIGGVDNSGDYWLGGDEY